MAALASPVVRIMVSFEGLMRSVTREATETAAAVREAFAGGEHEGLMTNIPRISQTRFVPFFGGHAVAGAANGIDLTGAQPAWVLRLDSVRLEDMVAGRAVARFAPHAEFMGHYARRVGDAKRARGMTGETAQDVRGRIEDAIPDTCGRLMSRRTRIVVDGAIPASPFFEIVLRIEPSDEGDCLLASSKRPIAGLRRLGGRERSRMAGGRLSLELGRMAIPTSDRARVVGSADRTGDGKPKQGRNSQSV